MPTIIDSLVVTLGLDSSGFKKGQKDVDKGLKDTKDNADQTAKDMEAAGKRAASFFGSIRTELLALVGVTLSAAGVKTFISSMTSGLQNLGNTSQALDMSSKSLDGWQRAAEAAGSSAEKITSTLGSFQNTLTKIRTGQAEGDPLFSALANFGAATGANFDYDADNAEAIMRKIAANWNKLSKDGRRAFGSMFGFDNATINSLNQGNLTRDADRFTQMSRATDEATKKAADFNRRLTEMKQNFSAASQVLYAALIPYVEKLIPLIEEFGNWISTHGPEIQKFFSDSAKEVGSVIDAVGGLQNALLILAAFVAGKWVIGMVGAISTVGASLSTLIANLASVVVKNPWLLMVVPTNDTPNQTEEDESKKSLAQKNLEKNRRRWLEENPGKPLPPELAQDFKSTAEQSSGKEVEQKAQSAKSPLAASTEEIRGDDRKNQQEANRLLDGILTGIKKVGSLLSDKEVPESNVQDQAGYLMRDRPGLPAEAPKPTKAGAALLGWMQPKLDSLEKAFNLPLGLLRSVATTESGGNPYAVSGAGAKGLFQFMDGTAKDMGLKGNDVFDPMKSAEAAAKYLSQLLRQNGGDLNKALASYNWGIGNVQRKGLENAPAETQAYVPKVLAGIKVGASANANVVNPPQQQQGPTNNINISKVDLTTSANNAQSLGADLQRTVQRNRLVTPAMSGQG